MAVWEFFKGRRVLLTGHTGFKGSWLGYWLTQLGAEVFGYALPPPTSPSLFDLLKLRQLLTHREADIRDLASLTEAFQAFKPEVVLHLAAQPLVRRSYREPKETFDTNVGGTVNVLEAIRHCPSVRSAVMVTSDKCYENREWEMSYRENDALGGHDPYSASKGAAEIVVASYRRSFFSGAQGQRCVGIASARAGNVIGGGDFAEDRIVPDAVRALTTNQRLELRNPRSTRPWQHVLDPVGAYLMLAVRLAEEPQRVSEAFNIGPELDGVATVQDLIAQFHAEMGRGRAVDVSHKQGNSPHEAKLLRLSCDKAHNILGWRSVFTTNEAIARTAGWYRRVLLERGNARAACNQDLRAFTERSNERWVMATPQRSKVSKGRKRR